jgi:hypothetical protein
VARKEKALQDRKKVPRRGKKGGKKGKKVTRKETGDKKGKQGTKILTQMMKEN